MHIILQNTLVRACSSRENREIENVIKEAQCFSTLRTHPKEKGRMKLLRKGSKHERRPFCEDINRVGKVSKSEVEAYEELVEKPNQIRQNFSFSDSENLCVCGVEEVIVSRSDGFETNTEPIRFTNHRHISCHSLPTPEPPFNPYLYRQHSLPSYYYETPPPLPLKTGSKSNLTSHTLSTSSSNKFKKPLNPPSPLKSFSPTRQPPIPPKSFTLCKPTKHEQFQNPPDLLNIKKSTICTNNCNNNSSNSSLMSVDYYNHKKPTLSSSHQKKKNLFHLKNSFQQPQLPLQKFSSFNRNSSQVSPPLFKPHQIPSELACCCKQALHPLCQHPASVHSTLNHCTNHKTLPDRDFSKVEVNGRYETSDSLVYHEIDLLRLVLFMHIFTNSL